MILIFLDLEMDARSMEFKNGEFDCVINKATMDAILVWVIVIFLILISVEKIH